MKIIDRTEGIGSEEFKRMAESEPFALFMTRVSQELMRAREACAIADSELDLRRAQGAYKALRAVGDLPARILAEIENRRSPVQT